MHFFGLRSQFISAVLLTVFSVSLGATSQTPSELVHGLEQYKPKALSTVRLQSLDVVRYWPLNDVGDLGYERISRKLGLPVRNQLIGVVPAVNCDFAEFRSGALVSDESELIEPLVEAQRSSLRLEWDRLRPKAFNRAAAMYPNWLGFLQTDDRPPLVGPELRRILNTQDTGRRLFASTSTLRLNTNSIIDRELVQTNYTVGGWFKPSSTGGSVRLLRKYFQNEENGKEVSEFQIFTHGNVVFFHNYRDEHAEAGGLYLSPDQARNFRAKNAAYYGESDSFLDVLRHWQSLYPEREDVASMARLMPVSAMMLPRLNLNEAAEPLPGKQRPLPPGVNPRPPLNPPGSGRGLNPPPHGGESLK